MTRWGSKEVWTVEKPRTGCRPRQVPGTTDHILLQFIHIALNSLTRPPMLLSTQEGASSLRIGPSRKLPAGRALILPQIDPEEPLASAAYAPESDSCS